MNQGQQDPDPSMQDRMAASATTGEYPTIPIDTGERRHWWDKLQDCLGTAFFASLFIALFLYEGFLDLDKIKTTKDTIIWYFGLFGCPIIALVLIIILIYQIWGLVTKRTIAQELKMSEKNEKLIEKFAVWGCGIIAGIFAIIIIFICFLFVGDNIKDFWNKTPGWALIIILLLIVLIVKNNNK